MVIENIVPNVDNSRFPGKSSAGELVRVEADIFVDGHDRIAAELRHRISGSGEWLSVDMSPLINDRWQGEFEVHSVGWHEFVLVAWVDPFATWRSELQKRVAAGQNLKVPLLVGSEIVEKAAAANDGEIAQSFSQIAARLRSAPPAEATEIALGSYLQALMRRAAPRLHTTEWPTPIKIWVDRTRARFSSLVRAISSFGIARSERGTAHLRDVEERLDAIAGMGFDVLYLPPIHPIGRAFRKGQNNTVDARARRCGQPLGDRRARRRARRDPSGAWARLTILTICCKRPASRASSWRWTWLSNARRIIRM